ncbi:MAG: type I restriction enzyme HsdR N-terminal domain-containing protein [Bacteroidaceae bacterium]|nr:type I restriction enzyme HsdR N-terminal domain-containing protein [Bacteroidaceae bacterium]
MNETTNLNLPAYDVRLKKDDNGRVKIFDILRRRYIALTPEEWVRQHFVNYMITEKGYPKSLLVNETQLQLGEKKLRCDSVVLGKDGKPCMIIEYKAPTIALTQRVFDQIAVYNMLLRVDYLIVSNGMQHICCKMNYEENSYEFLKEIPEYGKDC